MRFLFLSFVVLLTSCSWHPQNLEWQERYRYRKETKVKDAFISSPYGLCLMVYAPHLDYSRADYLLKTVAKHPSTGAMYGTVGHAWLILWSETTWIEGSHTGEFGEDEERYFDGVMTLVEEKDPNPIRYLHRELKDGCFQKGSGGFCPTFAIEIPLNEEKFLKIQEMIAEYDFQKYSLCDHTCVHFVVKAAEIAGVDLHASVRIPLPRYLQVGSECYSLWDDCQYDSIELQTPDCIEMKMVEQVQEGRAYPVTSWYYKTHYTKNRKKNSFVDYFGQLMRVHYFSVKVKAK